MMLDTDLEIFEALKDLKGEDRCEWGSDGFKPCGEKATHRTTCVDCHTGSLLCSMHAEVFARRIQMFGKQRVNCTMTGRVARMDELIKIIPL